MWLIEHAQTHTHTHSHGVHQRILRGHHFLINDFETLYAEASIYLLSSDNSHSNIKSLSSRSCLPFQRNVNGFRLTSLDIECWAWACTWDRCANAHQFSFSSIYLANEEWATHFAAHIKYAIIFYFQPHNVVIVFMPHQKLLFIGHVNVINGK